MTTKSPNEEAVHPEISLNASEMTATDIQPISVNAIPDIPQNIPEMAPNILDPDKHGTQANFNRITQRAKLVNFSISCPRCETYVICFSYMCIFICLIPKNILSCKILIFTPHCLYDMRKFKKVFLLFNFAYVVLDS